MKHRITIAVLLALASMSASATGTKTCPYGGKYPDCKPKPEEPKPGGYAEFYNDVRQQQQQGQHQTATGGNATGGTGLGVGYGEGGSVAGSGNSRNTNTAQGGASEATGGSVGNTTSGSLSNAAVGDVGSTSSIGNIRSGSESFADSNSGGNTLSNGSESTSGSASSSGGNTMTGGANAASADGSGNSEVSIDASDRSSNAYESQALFLPSVQTAAPAIVASPAVTVVPGVCSIRVERVIERAQAAYIGIVKRSSVDLGNDDIAVIPAAEPFRYHADRAGNVLVEGSRVDYAVFAVGAAASRSLGVGGGDTGGGWGQGGVSSGSSIQRPMVRALITPCLMPAAAVLPTIQFREPRIPRG